MIRLLLLLLLLAPWSPAHADELRPAYIQLDQISEGEWQLIWQASARSTLGREGQVMIPPICTASEERQSRTPTDGLRRESNLSCSKPIFGQEIGLRGLEISNTDALVRIQPLDSELITFRLTPDSPSAVIERNEGALIDNVALTYTVIGVEHIVFGFDHLLFVLCLVLLLKGWRSVAWAVTAFTVSHSITLIGTTLGYFALPSNPVETIIALSIVFLAAEIVKAEPDQPRLSERKPWLVAFLFGLLHGFGFAGALAEIGLPQNDRPLALLSFNIGVELGQLAVVAVAIIFLATIARMAPTIMRPLKLSLAYAIGTISMVWFLQRLLQL